MEANEYFLFIISVPVIIIGKGTGRPIEELQEIFVVFNWIGITSPNRKTTDYPFICGYFDTCIVSTQNRPRLTVNSLIFVS